MTDRFVTTARAVAEIHGVPEYRFVVIPHPIAGNSDDELGDKAERSLAEVLSLLTTRRVSPATSASVGAATGPVSA